MILTNFARIGKTFIRSITGVQENYKKTERVRATDFSVCLNCSLFNGDVSHHQIRYCKEFCNKPKEVVVKERTTYYNEANRFHIPVRERLSKFQLKQILLYHFLNIDNNGIVKNISTRQIASFLGCNVKTIKNNNKRFIELGYILYSESSRDEFTVWLKDYKSYHLTVREGGGGYITMSKELLKNFTKISNVNSLRLELRNLIEFDNKNIESMKINKGEYSFRDIKRFLPNYLRNKSAIKRIIEKGSDSFIVKVKEKNIVFKLKDELNAKILRKNILENCQDSFVEYYSKFNLHQDNLIDIYQMSVQYGVDRVKESLDKIYDDYVLNDKYIHNLGGLVRTFILHQKSA